MSFGNEASKLLTNKYFLYFMVFLATTNMLGYLVTHKINAVIFFALVSLLTYQFSKNMAVILLVAVIATNFLMANKKMREGLDNQIPTAPSKPTAPNSSKIEDIDIDIANTLPIVQGSKTNEEVNEQLRNGKNPVLSGIAHQQKPSVIDVNNPDKNTQTNEHEPEGFGGKMSNNKKNSEPFGPRLDYAATIEQSYANLDNLLGSDSIKQLTTDTQKLMSKQQQLYDTMQTMAPALQQAQSMLKGFDIKGLQESLKGMSGLDLGNASTITKAN